MTKSNAASKSSSPTPVKDSESQYGLNSKYVSPQGNQSRKRHISNNSQKKTDVSPEHGKRHSEMLESVHEKQPKTNTETHSVDRPPIKATGNSDDPINVDNLSQINLNTRIIQKVPGLGGYLKKLTSFHFDISYTHFSSQF